MTPFLWTKLRVFMGSLTALATKEIQLNFATTKLTGHGKILERKFHSDKLIPNFRINNDVKFASAGTFLELQRAAHVVVASMEGRSIGLQSSSSDVQFASSCAWDWKPVCTKHFSIILCQVTVSMLLRSSAGLCKNPLWFPHQCQCLAAAAESIAVNKGFLRYLWHLDPTAGSTHSSPGKIDLCLAQYPQPYAQISYRPINQPCGFMASCCSKKQLSSLWKWPAPCKFLGNIFDGQTLATFETPRFSNPANN